MTISIAIDAARAHGCVVLTDDEGNYLFYANKRIVCPDCFQPLQMIGQDDAYTYACPAHGSLPAPTSCPTCSAERIWVYPRNKGAMPCCRACEGEDV